MSSRRTAATVGVLFFVQLLTFMFGSQLVTAFLDGGAGKASLTIGVLLEICSGLAVVGIGLLMYPVLKVLDPRLAPGYPIMRITEFAVSVVLALYLLSQLEPFPNHLLWVYVPTGIGGILLNYLLFRSRLVPRPICVLGLVGYSLLLLLVPLDLLGVVTEGSGLGLVLLVPGGLYEFLMLPTWLIIRGFSPEALINAGPPAAPVPRAAADTAT